MNVDVQLAFKQFVDQRVHERLRRVGRRPDSGRSVVHKIEGLDDRSRDSVGPIVEMTGSKWSGSAIDSNSVV